MNIKAPPFPESLPQPYQCFEDEVRYDPGVHLDPEWPERIWTLEEFGYSPREISQCPSNVAVTSPFRLFSEEGIEAVSRVVNRLKAVRSSISGNRTPSHLAGGVYRSRFLRDLCACPVILEHMSSISGTRLGPHSLPSQQLYVNYSPDDITQAVDSWHYDGIGFDYVVMVTDPGKLKGGNFEYFQGTKYEVAEMFDMAVHQVRDGIVDELDESRVIQTWFPKAGYAIFQQGNMVVHRAARLLEPGDRITIVPGQVAEDISCPDPTAIHDIVDYGEPGIKAELARHGAWLAQGKLQHLIQNQDMSEKEKEILEQLKRAVADVNAVIEQLEQSGPPT